MKIYLDLKEYSNRKILKAITTIFFNPNFHSVLIYRLASIFRRIPILVILSKILTYINRIVYSVDIDYRAKLAGGFHLIHAIGTVIGKDVISEGPIKIYQGVTLGGNNKTRDYNGMLISQPILQSNVTIFANSTVIGPVIIGKNSIVGAHSIITKDVKENTKTFTRVIYNVSDILT